MLRVDTPPRSLDEYRGVADPGALAGLSQLADGLRGLRVLHVNSTRNGGGVSEVLRSAVPLLRDLGLECEWKVISAVPEFFEVTKRIHNGLQGHEVELDASEQGLWSEWQRRNAQAWEAQYDIIVVHDPQPLGLAAEATSAGPARWIWRLHIDTSSMGPGVWEFLRPFMDPYDALVFSLPHYAPPDLPAERIRVIPPAIDPLTEKNRAMPLGEALRAVSSLGIDLRRPLLAQVSRLDPWKDPVGVVRAFETVRRSHPGAQLALLGAIEADDDPEAALVAAEVKAEAGDDPAIHVITDPARVGPGEVGAVQLLADVVLQKSLREGFGLTVAEALWKSTPVVGGRVGGVVLQIQDGRSGFLVDSPEEAAERCAWLLANPAESRAMGAAGRAFVRERYLITRLLADELTLYREVLARAGKPQHQSAARLS